MLDLQYQIKLIQGIMENLNSQQLKELQTGTQLIATFDDGAILNVEKLSNQCSSEDWLFAKDLNHLEGEDFDELEQLISKDFQIDETTFKLVYSEGSVSYSLK
jgi:hypothetical protein